MARDHQTSEASLRYCAFPTLPKFLVFEGRYWDFRSWGDLPQLSELATQHKTKAIFTPHERFILSI